jgi:hypothetical protein
LIAPRSAAANAQRIRRSTPAREKKLSAPSAQIQRKVKTPAVAQIGDVVAKIQFPNFATRRETRRPGRPQKRPEFEVRVAQGGFSVYLSRTGKQIDYCCFLPPGEFSSVTNYPFEEFVSWVLRRMQGRERSQENGGKIDGLISTIRKLAEEEPGAA